MTKTHPVQIEVNVQDYFFADSTSDHGIDVIEPVVQPISREPMPPELKSSGEVDLGAFTSVPVSATTWEHWFCHWLEHLSDDRPSAQAYELTLRLTDDQEIRSLNAQYRQKDQATDVLAFAALEADYPLPEELQRMAPLYLGDIVISVETAHRQAQQQQHSLEQELAWLAAHALLHLLGWDHPDEASLTCMLDQQKKLLQLVDFNADYD